MKAKRALMVPVSFRLENTGPTVPGDASAPHKGGNTKHTQARPREAFLPGAAVPQDTSSDGGASRTLTFLPSVEYSLVTRHCMTSIRCCRKTSKLWEILLLRRTMRLAFGSPFRKTTSLRGARSRPGAAAAGELCACALMDMLLCQGLGQRRALFRSTGCTFLLWEHRYDSPSSSCSRHVMLCLPRGVLMFFTPKGRGTFLDKLSSKASNVLKERGLTTTLTPRNCGSPLL